MRRLSFFLLLMVSVAACRPLYLPPLIESEQPEPRARLTLELVLEQERPLLLVSVLDVPEEGWLAVQWFAPGSQEVASQSIWLDPDAIGQNFRLPLPEDVQSQAGTWRALVSQHSLVLRQLDVTVP